MCPQSKLGFETPRPPRSSGNRLPSVCVPVSMCVCVLVCVCVHLCDLAPFVNRDAVFSMGVYLPPGWICLALSVCVCVCVQYVCVCVEEVSQ